MKYLYFTFILISSIALNAQDHFSIVDNQLQWQKVYESEFSKSELQNSIKNEVKFEDLYKTLASRVGPFKFDCEQTTPIYMRNGFTYYVRIDHKPEKYRVTISNIMMIPSSTIDLYGVRSSESPENFSEYIIKNNGKLRTNNMTQNVMECLDKKFQKHFDFEPINSDW